MELQINGQLQHFKPIRSFCATFGLPGDFSIALFQPKNDTGLGSIDKAQAQLTSLHNEVLAAVPRQPPLEGWTAFSIKLQLLFQAQLREANSHIGLKASEITYAVAGFADACQAVIYEASKAQMMGRELPVFPQIYMKWLNNTVEVSHKVYDYAHNNEAWKIRTIKHIYGRIGLMIEAPNTIHYVQDMHLACPAEGFMYILVRDVTNIILATYTDQIK